MRSPSDHAERDGAPRPRDPRLDQAASATSGEPRYQVESGVDGGPLNRIEIRLRVVGAAVDRAEWPGRRAYRNRFHPAKSARGDIAERPRGVEKASLTRISVSEADAFVLRIVGQTLAVRIAPRAIALGPMR